MSRQQKPTLDTPGKIAAKLGVPLWRVQYVLATRDISPVAYAGRLRLFDRAAVARIRHEINAIEARRLTDGKGVAK